MSGGGTQRDLFGDAEPLDHAAGAEPEQLPVIIRKGKPQPHPPAPVEAKLAPEPAVEQEPIEEPSDDTPPPPASGGGGGSGIDSGPLKELIDDNFLAYASYVIRDRAIPDLDDGLKPVQRRILHSLKENDDGKFIKVANIVGHTMQYHPHGDASIADALVTLANKRYLIEGQGNFGNLLTGDPPAASRYIECRLTELARTQIFNDELTKFIPSYDGRKKEPVCLPAKLPLLLMMGAEGIAVGLSTKVLPHNFGELLDAQIAILQKKPFEVLPDFQQGGLMDAAEYDKGKGRIRLRSRIEKKGDTKVVIRSVPFGVTTDSLMASIEAAAKKKSLQVKSINDYTAEQVEIEIELKAGQKADKTIQALYAFTQCQVALSSRIVTIKNQRPVELDVEQVLRHNTKHLTRTLKRELEAEKRKLLDELHAKTLVQIFIENRIYKRIEECTTYDAVTQAVLDGVNEHRELLRRDVTNKDVEMLLGIKIKRISRYDMNRNRKEIGDILTGLETVDKNLGQLTAYAIRYLRAIKKKYAGDYPRLTEVTSFESIEVRKITANELTLTFDPEKNYFGHAVGGSEELFQCSSLDKIMVVRGDGGYKLVNPPDKMFVEGGIRWCALPDREKIFVAVYRDPDDNLSYIKRFTFGGAILNKEYRYIPESAELLYFSTDDPKKLWVKYKKKKGQRIHQQTFDVSKVKVRAVKARGIQMTSKTVDKFYESKPRGWSDDKSGPAGVFLGM